MSGVTFTLTAKGVEDLLSEPAASAFLAEIGEQIARDWARLDPRTKPGGHEPPEISVSSGRDSRGVVVRVSTEDGIWHIIEFGSVNNPPYRPATKAVENAGLKLEDSSG